MTKPWKDPSPHRSFFVKSNGVRIHCLDWGGRGPPLILIHGITDNPHAFDDLALRLKPWFRVIAYARRGHGLSDARGPYNAATLTEDLRGVMDRLGIRKAHLAGWSMGGLETTGMAAEYPSRVLGIVYLDAAYDFTDKANRRAKSPPVRFRPPRSAFRSFEAYRRWFLSLFPELTHAGWLDAYLRENLVMKSDGSVRLRMPPRAEAAMAKTLMSEPKEYESVHAPVLAIYATSLLDPRCKVIKGGNIPCWERKYMAPFRNRSIAQIRKALPEVRILRVPGSHGGFFTTSAGPVATAMHRFLKRPM